MCAVFLCVGWTRSCLAPRSHQDGQVARYAFRLAHLLTCVCCLRVCRVDKELPGAEVHLKTSRLVQAEKLGLLTCVCCGLVCRVDRELSGAEVHIKTSGPVQAERSGRVWNLPSLPPRDTVSHTFQLKLLG